MPSCLRTPALPCRKFRFTSHVPGATGPRVYWATLFSGGRLRATLLSLTLLLLLTLLPSIASAQQTISTSIPGPIYGNGTSIEVTSSGAITDNGSGAGVISTGTNTTTTLTNAGTITASNSGVLSEASGSFDTIANFGIIAGGTAVASGGTLGTLTNSGTIVGSDQGLFLTTTGTVSNLAGGLIQGTDTYGIVSSASLGLLDNAGAILGGLTGVNIAAGSVTDFANTGSITGYSGVRMEEGTTLGTLTNSGTMAGSSVGVQVMATGTVDNSGTISADSDGFWALSSIGSFTNRGTGRIEGGASFSGPTTTLVNDGLITDNLGTACQSFGDVGTFTNNGTITGGNSGFSQWGDTLGTLINTGTVSGEQTGLSLGGAIGTIDNSGSIAGNTYWGISVNGTVGTFINRAGGQIEGSYTGVSISGTAVSVVNEGLITSAERTAFRNNGEIAALTNSGTMAGLYYGFDQAGTLPNFTNTATGLLRGEYGAGFLADTSTGSIENYGTISSGGFGVNALYSLDTLTNHAGGVISGDGAGVFVYDTFGLLDNQAGGVIESAEGPGVFVRGWLGSVADTIANAGVIRGATAGVQVEYDGILLELANTGTITSSAAGPSIVVGPSGVLGDETGAKGPAIVSTGAGAWLDGGIVNSGTINQGFQIENQDVSVAATEAPGVFNGGTLDVVDGNLTFTSGTIGLNADVSVNGGSGTFFNQATLSLFDSQTVTGHFAQTSDATTLLALLGWQTPGSYGHLDITGSAVFAGSLALDDTQLAGGLAGGQTFELFGFGSYTGRFAALLVDGVSLLSLGEGQWAYGSLALTEEWTSTSMSLVITNVPEIDPTGFGTPCALLMGALGWAERKARRRVRPWLLA